mmetsp:Transcript_101800/g.287156  ORF Transcript_101800/g.287156 Transcript_101800/m.287156 type:complete len:483 (+) Transcript_101800:104-1552(+)
MGGGGPSDGRSASASSAKSGSRGCDRAAGGDRGHRRRRRTAPTDVSRQPPQPMPPPVERERRRRRREDEGPEDGKRHHKGRSRSRRRRDGKKGDGTSGTGSAMPPVDWLGPGARGPPPAEWRGPSRDIPRDWRGPVGMYAPPPGADPRWYADRTSSRPMYPPPLRPGAPPHWGPPPGGIPPPRAEGAPHFRGEPPAEWRGPAMHQPGPTYGSRGATEAPDLWAPSRSSGPCAPGPWRGGASTGASGPPGGPLGGSGGGPSAADAGRAGGETEKAFDASSSKAPGVDNVAAAAGLAAGNVAQADHSLQGGVGDGGNGMDGGVANSDEEGVQAAPPVPNTAAERLRGLSLVRSALSPTTLASLRSAGVNVDAPAAMGATSPATCGAAVASAEATSTAQMRCGRLGLDGGTSQRNRLPPPMPTPPRLPVCTLDLKHVGLWERFRQRCGTQAPPDAPPAPCEIRKSRFGGSILAPCVVAMGDATAS